MTNINHRNLKHSIKIIVVIILFVMTFSNCLFIILRTYSHRYKVAMYMRIVV